MFVGIILKQGNFLFFNNSDEKTYRCHRNEFEIVVGTAITSVLLTENIQTVHQYANIYAKCRISQIFAQSAEAVE